MGNVKRIGEKMSFESGDFKKWTTTATVYARVYVRFVNLPQRTSLKESSIISIPSNDLREKAKEGRLFCAWCNKKIKGTKWFHVVSDGYENVAYHIECWEAYLDEQADRADLRDMERD